MTYNECFNILSLKHKKGWDTFDCKALEHLKKCHFQALDLCRYIFNRNFPFRKKKETVQFQWGFVG